MGTYSGVESPKYLLGDGLLIDLPWCVRGGCIYHVLCYLGYFELVLVLYHLGILGCVGNSMLYCDMSVYLGNVRCEAFDCVFARLFGFVYCCVASHFLGCFGVGLILCYLSVSVCLGSSMLFLWYDRLSG